jgi:phospholipid transport system substrate-binding protein
MLATNRGASRDMRRARRDPAPRERPRGAQAILPENIVARTAVATSSFSTPRRAWQRRLGAHVATIAVASMVAVTARAEDISGDAGRFVAGLRDHLQAIVDLPRGDDPDADRSARLQEFQRLFLDAFDVEAIGRFSLGPYWRDTTAAEQREFLALFQDNLVAAYAGRFVRYAGRPFHVVDSRAEGSDHAVVTSETMNASGTSGDRIGWRVLKRRGHLKIVDVMVQGVSISTLQQAGYRSYLDRRGGQVESLIDELRRRADSTR